MSSGAVCCPYMTQDEALNILKTGCNVFLTGQAGSGKTYLLNQYIQYLKGKKVVVAVTASTGIAATHMDGMTVHSWSGIGIKDSMTERELRELFHKDYLNVRFRNTKVLIIDEISMLDCNRLDLVQQVSRMMKGNFEPFGGMQVILCGDFFQLPPVIKEGNLSLYFAFKSDSWGAMDLRVCYLDSQHRQTSPEYLAVLNAVRSNTVGQETMHILKRRHQAPMQEKITRLYTHNMNVDAINSIELAELPGKPKVFEMQSSGVERLVRDLKKNCLAPEVLTLKEDAVVMFVKNNFDRGYVNGTLGVVKRFDEQGNPIVRTRKGDEIAALPESWRYEVDGQVLAQIHQVPLRLAWAITVHKSQGMSLDAAEVDLSKAFVPGMGYVALSRIRSLDGLRLMGLNEQALQVDPEVLAFDMELMALSEREVKKLRGMSRVDLKRLHKEFIDRNRSKNKV